MTLKKGAPVMISESYIMFHDSQKGFDGYVYTRGVKYKLQKETATALHLAGKMGKHGMLNMNVLHKANLRGRYTTGKITRE